MDIFSIFREEAESHYFSEMERVREEAESHYFSGMDRYEKRPSPIIFQEWTDTRRGRVPLFSRNGESTREYEERPSPIIS